MTDFNAIMHQITALPQTLQADLRGLLLRGGIGWKGKGREGWKGKGREWGKKGRGDVLFLP